MFHLGSGGRIYAVELATGKPLWDCTLGNYPEQYKAAVAKVPVTKAEVDVEMDRDAELWSYDLDATGAAPSGTYQRIITALPKPTTVGVAGDAKQEALPNGVTRWIVNLKQAACIDPDPPLDQGRDMYIVIDRTAGGEQDNWARARLLNKATHEVHLAAGLGLFLCWVSGSRRDTCCEGMNLRKERIMGGRYIDGLLDAYIDGVLSREELTTLSQMLRYCPEVREVVRIRGQAVGDMSLVRRAAVAMPSRAEQRAM